MTRAYKKPGRPPCTVEGCSKPLYARGMCTMHYTRLRARGDIGTAEAERGTPGEGAVNEYGYRVLNLPGHPLARAQGKVLEHRAVLFDAIGPGDHPCHWCGVVLPWLGDSTADCINVDHLDHVKLHNVRTNLVVSCLDCNTKRRAMPHVPVAPKPRVYTEEQRARKREYANAYYVANRDRILAKKRETPA